MTQIRNPTSFAVYIAALACSLLFNGCTDNATRLSLAIERVARPLDTNSRGTTVEVPFHPKERPSAPYTLIFFPDHRTTPDDLVEAGVAKDLVDRIFGELNYLGIGERSTLVVAQPGARLHFTTHWTKFAEVEDLLVLEGRGTRSLLLEKQGERMIIRGWK